MCNASSVLLVMSGMQGKGRVFVGRTLTWGLGLKVSRFRSSGIAWCYWMFQTSPYWIIMTYKGMMLLGFLVNCMLLSGGKKMYLWLVRMNYRTVAVSRCALLHSCAINRVLFPPQKMDCKHDTNSQFWDYNTITLGFFLPYMSLICFDACAPCCL